MVDGSVWEPIRPVCPCRGGLDLLLRLAIGVIAVSLATPPTVAQTGAGAGTGAATQAGDTTAPRSEAERIINLERLLEADRQQQKALEEEGAQLKIQFDKASAEFERLDTQLTDARERRDHAPEPSQKAAISDEVAAVQKLWAAARDRFDLVIERRKAVQAEAGTLVDKIAFEQQILDGWTSFETSPGAQAGTADSTASPRAAPSGATGRAEAAHPVKSSPEGAHAPATTAAPAQAAPVEEGGPPQDLVYLDDDLLKARKAQVAAQAALEAAEQHVARLDRGIDLFDRDLASSRQLLETARREYQAAQEAQHAVRVEEQQRRAAGAPEAELAALHDRMAAAEKDLARTQEDVVRQSGRVANSGATVEHLKKTRAESTEKLRTARADAKSARNLLMYFESPVAPHRLRWWAAVRGPRVLAVIAAMGVLWWLARVIGRRLVAGVVLRGRRGTQVEREGRAETIRRAFQSGASAAILVLGVLAMLHQAGIDVTVLLGGTAVVGAAIAFGSQNMVKDYFGGFMILIENQYSVGNVVRIGEITGTVEGITLRMTSLRDLEGIVHFIPHSQVTQVSNLTYGWSRIVLDVRVAAGEDVDRVMTVLMEVAGDLASDPEFGPQLVEKPEMLGVDSVASTGIVIKLLVKTQPLRRWTVKRELLRRIKKTFDAQGIKVA
jgi:moderate conductance mechanosensitive channel